MPEGPPSKGEFDCTVVEVMLTAEDLLVLDESLVLFSSLFIDEEDEGRGPGFRGMIIKRMKLKEVQVEEESAIWSLDQPHSTERCKKFCL